MFKMCKTSGADKTTTTLLSASSSGNCDNKVQSLHSNLLRIGQLNTFLETVCMQQTMVWWNLPFHRQSCRQLGSAVSFSYTCYYAW